MRKSIFLPIIILIISSCTYNSATKQEQSYEDSIISQMVNEQFKRDSHAERPKLTPEDSMLNIIQEQFRKENPISKYYNVSKNTKKIVPSGFGYVKVPDSIAYVKVFYKNGNICEEGYITFFESREADGVEVGKWKYCTPDGTKFEKYYKYTIGIQKDSI